MKACSQRGLVSGVASQNKIGVVTSPFCLHSSRYGASPITRSRSFSKTLELSGNPYSPRGHRAFQAAFTSRYRPSGSRMAVASGDCSMAVRKCSSVEDPRFSIPMSPFFSETQMKGVSLPCAVIVYSMARKVWKKRLIFRESDEGEVPRIPLLGTSVNRGYSAAYTWVEDPTQAEEDSHAPGTPGQTPERARHRLRRAQRHPLRRSDGGRRLPRHVRCRTHRRRWTGGDRSKLRGDGERGGARHREASCGRRGQRRGGAAGPPGGMPGGGQRLPGHGRHRPQRCEHRGRRRGARQRHRAPEDIAPPEAVVPIGWVAVGDRANILPPGDHRRIWE